MTRRYVFGPVASRRLGVSLGVDLVTPKTCSLDCVYCEAKATTNLTLERKEYVPVAEVLRELKETLDLKPELDFITFSGAGEPTLNSGIGRVLDFLKDNYPQYKVCLLTNALSFTDPEVRREVSRADRVVPSLDASNEAEFQAVNRPVPGLTFAAFLEGLEAFCRESRAEIYLELFIAPGFNDSDESIARFADIIRRLRVDRIQLNTLDRPGVIPELRPSTPENTRRFIRALEPIAPVEAVGPFRYKSRSTAQPVECGECEKRVLDLALRRPVTAADLECALGMPDEELRPLLKKLFEGGLLEIEKEARGTFYSTTR